MIKYSSSPVASRIQGEGAVCSQSAPEMFICLKPFRHLHIFTRHGQTSPCTGSDSAVCETPPYHVAYRQLRAFFLVATHPNCACAMLSSLRIPPVIATPSRTMIILYQQTYLLRFFAHNYWFACYGLVWVACEYYPYVGTPVRVFPLCKSSLMYYH